MGGREEEKEGEGKRKIIDGMERWGRGRKEGRRRRKVKRGRGRKRLRETGRGMTKENGIEKRVSRGRRGGHRKGERVKEVTLWEMRVSEGKWTSERHRSFSKNEN